MGDVVDRLVAMRIRSSYMPVGSPRLRPLLASRVPVSGSLARAARSAGVSPSRITVADHDELVACAFGLLRPQILISNATLAALTHAELQAVLAHEDHRVRRSDPLRVALAQITAGGLFMIPIIEDIRRHFVLTMELEAERSAISRASGLRSLAFVASMAALLGLLTMLPPMMS